MIFKFCLVDLDEVSNFLLDMSLSMTDNLAEHLPVLMPHILKKLEDKENTSIRINMLQMLCRVFRGAKIWQLQTQLMIQQIPHIKEAIEDNYFKILAEGLRVSGVMSRLSQALNVDS